MELLDESVYLPELPEDYERLPARPVASFFARRRGRLKSSGSDVPEPRPDLVAVCAEIRESLVLPRQARLGRGAQRELVRRLDGALLWARHRDDGVNDFRMFAQAAARTASKRFDQKFTSERLELELWEQCLRDQAFENDDSLLRYLGAAATWLRNRQSASAQRYRVRGERDEELVQDTVADLVELVRSGQPAAFVAFELSGLPAWSVVYDRRRSRLRREKRLFIAVMNDGGAWLHQPVPDPEGILLQRERERRVATGLKHLGHSLTCPQQRTLAQLAVELERGGLRGAQVRVAQALGRGKPAMSRMMDRIADVADSLGLSEIVDIEIGRSHAHPSPSALPSHVVIPLSPEDSAAELKRRSRENRRHRLRGWLRSPC